MVCIDIATMLHKMLSLWQKLEEKKMFLCISDSMTIPTCASHLWTLNLCLTLLTDSWENTPASMVEIFEEWIGTVESDGSLGTYGKSPKYHILGS